MMMCNILYKRIYGDELKLLEIVGFPKYII
jgi:hypothetical protein